MGIPPQDVIVWSILGGLCSLWITRQPENAMTWRAAWYAMWQVVVSASAGIVVSTLLLHAAENGVTWLQAIDRAPHWALAALLAALATKVGPIIATTVGAWFNKKAGEAK